MPSTGYSSCVRRNTSCDLGERVAIREFFPIRFEVVFPHGAYLNSEVMPVFAYEDGKKMGQAVHPETGERMWSVTVIDGDPELKAADKAVTVKLISGVQPVPPNS